ncbi:MAG: saccharopine dehydrogenase NADP-binding domain-containing protein [Actinobacteria bacterium]|nr:saccharopine dehydrogenase NADP-binding domain-containing protein [Actinomycetota bacterium]
MSGRVILFGATGYTGRLTAEAMTRAGLAPVLAGRSEESLVDLVADLAGLGPIDRAPTWRRADVADPSTVRALVEGPDDVLVSTVGPFADLGHPALDAAVAAGCAYVDSTGEATFIRDVFETAGPRAQHTGARLLTAFGYDYVPGNLAAALAIRDAHDTASGPVTVEVGYFVRGGMGLSSGTRATAARTVRQPPPALRNGRIGPARGGVVTFDVDDQRLDGLPVGGSEVFALPRLDDRVRDVGVYLGWMGRWTRAAHVAGGIVSAAARVPGVGSLIGSGMRRAGGSATGQGPSASERAGSVSVAVARTLDGVGRELSRARVEGPSPYDLTAELLAWGAAMLLTRQETSPGALGPADAFGLAALESGCADIGLVRVP